jgi:hypothetical protein
LRDSIVERTLRSVRAKSILCAVVGHRWSQPADVHEPYPLVECLRCGRRQELAPGTGTPFGGRLDAETGRDKSVGPFGPGR